MNKDVCNARFGDVLLRKGNHIEGLTYLEKSEGFIKFSLKKGLFIC